MPLSNAVRRWSSVASPTSCGLEVIGSASIPEQVGSCLDSIHAQLNATGAAFILMRLAPTDHAGVETALTAASSRADLLETRVCLAIDRWTLSRVNTAHLDLARAGLLLDDVDDETSPSHVVHEAIEAIRLQSDFVRRAASRVRLACALTSTLGLARNLGLAALGPAVPDTRLVSGVTFDYLASPISEDDELAVPSWTAHSMDSSRRQQELQLGR